MKKSLIVWICIVIAVSGFTYYSFKSTITKVDAVISEFHQRYNAQDFEYIYQHIVSEEFRRLAPYQPYLDFMRNMYNNTGRIKEAKRGAWGVFYKNIGPTFNVSYNTTNEKANVGEYFTLVRKDKGWLVLLYDPKIKK